MSYGRSCIGEVHVFRMAYLTICYVLLKDMFYWRSYLLEGKYYRRAYIAVGDVLLGYGRHVFHENVCYGRTCVVGGHVLQVCAEATIYAAVSLGIWHSFLSTVSFVCSETCFPRIYCLNIFLWYVGSFIWSLCRL